MPGPEDDVDLSNKMAELFNDDTLRTDYEPPEQEGEQGQQRQQPTQQQEGAEQEGQQEVQQLPQRRGQQQQRREHTPQPRQQRQRPTAAQNGDLVDAQGNVVARAGNERRFYEQARMAEHAITQIRVENSQLKQKLSAYDDAWKSYEAAGVAPADVPAAMALIARFRKEPVAAVKDLLTQMANSGIDISPVTGQNSGTMDSVALKRIVDDALKPFMQERQQRTEQEANMTRARQEYDGFIAQYPHAEANLDTLRQMIQRYPNVPLETMWLRIENWAVRNGLDPSQPFNLQQQQNGGAPTDTRRGLPNGRFSARGATVSRGNNNGQLAPDASSRDIVREAMREAGYNV